MKRESNKELGVRIKDARSIEADDDLAMKVRNEKYEARMRQLQNERDAKDRVVKEK
jgi:hypothetical protein